MFSFKVAFLGLALFGGSFPKAGLEAVWLGRSVYGTGWLATAGRNSEGTYYLGYYGDQSARPWCDLAVSYSRDPWGSYLTFQWTADRWRPGREWIEAEPHPVTRTYRLP